jgi:hypothetical protein
MIEYYYAYVAYYVLSVICVLLNLLVVGIILLRKFRTPFIELIFYFHISVIGDVLTALPYIYKNESGWCTANESFKFYFGLMNILIIFFLIQAHRIQLFHENKIFTARRKFCTLLLIFSFPLIAFLPYIDKVYGDAEGPWCILSYGRAPIWVIMVQFIWIFLLSLSNFITHMYIIAYFIHHSYDPKLLVKFMLNVFAYSSIATLSWIPRIRNLWDHRKNEDDDNASVTRFYQFYPVVIAGICYVILFFINRNALFQYEREKSQNTDGSLHFNTKDILNIVDNTENSTLSNLMDVVSDYFQSFSIRRDSISMQAGGGDGRRPSFTAERRASQASSTTTNNPIYDLEKPKSISELRAERVISATTDGINLNPI